MLGITLIDYFVHFLIGFIIAMWVLSEFFSDDKRLGWLHLLAVIITTLFGWISLGSFILYLSLGVCINIYKWIKSSKFKDLTIENPFYTYRYKGVKK